MGKRRVDKPRLHGAAYSKSQMELDTDKRKVIPRSGMIYGVSSCSLGNI